MHPTDQPSRTTSQTITPTRPESTYRVQFHKGFTFRDAAAMVPYLHELGITHLYASPYLKAAPGSTHGYDVIDPCVLNPEVGTTEDFERLVSTLAQHGITHILDTVPNHMGVATNENNWWNDVLEDGPLSPYANYFDIAWRDSCREQMTDKLLLPVLGKSFGDAIDSGELKLALTEANAIAVQYFDRQFPISPATLAAMLRAHHERVPFFDVAELRAELNAVVEGLENLPDDPQRRFDARLLLRRRLAKLLAESPAGREAIGASLTEITGDRLGELLERQSYRLASWKTAADEINYRRFFDINDLAALRMEREEVFRDAEAFTLKLVAEGTVAGLRVDHPDGLRDPAQYFRRLQEAGVGYVSVEKILAVGEQLPGDWPVQGTSGYDFMNEVNGLFVDADNEAKLDEMYRGISGDKTAFADLAYQKKRMLLDLSFGGELHMLTSRLDRLSQRDRGARDFSFRVLREALREVIACFPVYRSYIAAAGQVRPEDVVHIETAVEQAIQRNALTDPSVFRYVRDVLLFRRPAKASAAEAQEQLEFVARFQQLTSPVTAKGIEDTAFYLYNRFISINEVGGDPDRFGVTPDSLHQYFIARQKKWPYALSALSTHDTKRSEDVRARLNVLSEIPEQWQSRVAEWMNVNTPARDAAGGSNLLQPNEEYLLYQTIVGAWPLNGQADETFVKRIQAYMLKATREGKVRTSWTQPNEQFEKAMHDFIAAILGEGSGAGFVSSLRPFVEQVSHYGLLNSLSQTVLRLAAPGVSDTYQGTDLWDFSLVDPDNRRSVDYAARATALRELGDTATSDLGMGQRADALVHDMKDGRIKLHITSTLLKARREHPGLFTAGDYLPIPVEGTYGEHAFAFARKQDDALALVVIPRLIAKRFGGVPGKLPLAEEAWSDTRLPLPAVATKRQFRNFLTGELLLPGEGSDGPSASLASLLARFPVGVFLAEKAC